MDHLATRFDAPLSLVARLLLSVLFVMAGMDAGLDMQKFGARLAADGLPFLIVGPVFWFLILTGLGLALGIKARWLGLAMAAFSLASGLLDYTDFQQPTDMVMLLKNIALTGGYLYVALHGAGAWSVDGMIARHKARTAPARR
jgi:putative oxidoreductase